MVPIHTDERARAHTHTHTHTQNVFFFLPAPGRIGGGERVVIQSHMVLDHRVFCALAVWVEPSHSSVPERERGGEGGGER